MKLKIWAALLTAILFVGDTVAQQQKKDSTKNRNPAQTGKKANSGGLSEFVTVERDVVYGDAGNRPLKLDIVRPKNPKSTKLPVVAFIHGGGWSGGDKSMGIAPLAALVRNGEYFGVTVSYRFSNEAQWPAQIHDCKAAIRWLRANADKYGIDPEKIGCWGPSAGGHLVAMLATTGNVASLEGDCGSKGFSSKVACAVDFFGPTDLIRYGMSSKYPEGGRASELLEKLFGGKVDAKVEAVASASPNKFVSKESAPMLMMHGDKDPLVPLSHSELLKAALDKVNVPATLVVVKNAGHGFGGMEVAIRVQNFFDKYLRGKDVEISDQAIEMPAQPNQRKKAG